MTRDKALARGVALAEWARGFYGAEDDFLGELDLLTWGEKQGLEAEAAAARGDEEAAAMHEAASIIACDAHTGAYVELLMKYGGSGQRYLVRPSGRSGRAETP